MSIARKRKEIAYIAAIICGFVLLYLQSRNNATKSDLMRMLEEIRKEKNFSPDTENSNKPLDDVKDSLPAVNDKAENQAMQPAAGADNGSRSLRRSNRGIAEYSQQFYDRFHTMTSRKASSRDPELISLVREIIDPPSDSGTHKVSLAISPTPQVREVEAILKQKVGGFFFECGALDGERSSNTFFLEKKWNWTGLLVEMDPHYYTQLLGKNRRSWSINACLSPYDYATELPFYGDNGGQGRVALNANQNNKASTKGRVVPCFPFETLMLALGRTHIDYFSLDVEGVEYPIMQTIPFEKITIDVMSVEYGHDGERKNQTANFMINKGFRLHKDIHFSNIPIRLYVEDFIFVRNGLKVVGR